MNQEKTFQRGDAEQKNAESAEKNMNVNEMNFASMMVQFGKLELKPGDILVLMFAGRLSTEAVKGIYEGMKKILPQSVQVMILEDNVQIGVLSPEWSGLMTKEEARRMDLGQE